MDEVKVCSRCGEIKDRSHYPKKHGRICRDCRNAAQRESRAKTGNRHTKVYEKTVKGYLMRTYRNMLSRVTGVQYKKAHLYEGKEILDKEDFYKWSSNNLDFTVLFENWTASGYDAKLAPSIDRIDSSRGYTLDNMRWLTHSENSKLGSESQRRNKKEE